MDDRAQSRILSLTAFAAVTQGEVAHLLHVQFAVSACGLETKGPLDLQRGGCFSGTLVHTEIGRA